jgi:integrase
METLGGASWSRTGTRKPATLASNSGSGEEARVRHAMEYRFGALADYCLARHAILTDGDNRWKLVRALAEAMNDAARKLAKNAAGDYRPDPNADRFPELKLPIQPSAPSGAPTKSEPTVAQLFAAWRSHALRLNAKPNTLDRYAPCLRSLDAWASGRAAASLSEDDIWEWAEARTSKVSPKTVNRVDLAAVKSVFTWATSRAGGRVLLHNPARGVRLDEPNEAVTRSALFTNEEWNAILLEARRVPDDADNPTLGYAKRWVAWIAAYTGARVSEITQLRGQDVRREGDTWVLDFNPEAGGIKTNEARIVPVHEHLVEPGFPAFAASRGKGPLFYDPTRRQHADAKRSQAENRSGEIAEWVREVASLDPRIAPNHTWRRMFKSIAIEAGISTRLSDWLTGHARQKRRRGAAADYEVPTLAALAKAVRQFPRYQLPE